MRWLNGGAGGAAGGWTFLLLAPAAIAVLGLVARHVNPRLREGARGWTRTRSSIVDLARFGLVLLTSIALATAAGALLAALGLDPRGPVVGTYVQRNSLVVGFVMGFAIIPIIYTIAEDALAAVPDHLRSASLAAGATPWQTAWRIVIPTATSGLFSAVMIGLGRAVGETMIVLMAAGNTPILDWNIFNGFRTLSANIAVELPEAVRNSTHYRTLFLAALVLFMMTFVLNTAAEIVRIRFRRKAQQL
jgi:phosphate transport system permease protein